ncbi:MAG TPA: AmmeMemoRadiSam system protein A [Candidatus Acidoferrales bacterium]|nr:AmmeMemoRadiSam system protein A [Candidatus Acidoferrales bacterium]
MSSLDNREKLLLLAVARRTVIAAVESRPSDRELPAELSALECAGVFVTLRRCGRLRGCIGQIAVRQPAAELVAYSARAAALEDPRFEPIRKDELTEIEIELSVLSPPEPIAPERVEAGRHGLIVSRGFQRGVLLPQVATEHRWESLRFLEETCVKAGLERDAWNDPQTQILAFTAQVFSESEIAGNVELKAHSL